MNELLQKHGCANVFTVPEGLKELMSDITREVLRWQPAKMLDFIANYLSALLITREHGIMAVKILDDLCDCRPSVSEHLLQIGLEPPQVDELANIIKGEIEGHEPVEGKEKVKETAILKKVLNRFPLDEEMSAKVCQVARNAYRDYWYRKATLKKGLSLKPDEAWEKAAQHTLAIYKKTKPSISELHRATQKIQAAYRGYHVRRNVLRHLMPQDKKAKPGRKVEMPGPPLDIASSREIDLGPVINIKIKEDDVGGMFDEEAGQKLGLKYDPMKTITHKDDDDFLEEQAVKKPARIQIGGFSEPPKPQFNIMEATVSTKSAPIPTEGFSLPSEPEKYIKSYGTPASEDFTRSLPRISFAEAPPEFIRRETEEEELEIPEIPGINTQPVDHILPPGAFEVPEELAGDSDRMSSGPPSARTTDIEDARDDD